MWRPRHHHFLKLIVLVAVVLIVVAVIKRDWEPLEKDTARNSYQAVFLTNGQVYFGKLMRNPGGYKLTDIYYLQVTQPLQQAGNDSSKAPTATGTAANTQPNVQLVKLGSELHGPEDAMYLSGQNVLFWENLKSDSKVVDAINKYISK